MVVDVAAAADQAVRDLAGWLSSAVTVRVRGRPVLAAVGRLRFAFYGRTSTSDWQDPASSRAWQLSAARDCVAGHGLIVVEYVDIGCSRTLPWSARPRAATLLAAATDPGRCFDAVVVGEYERAFAGGQLADLLPVLQDCNVQLWLPEIGGPINAADPAHRALLLVLGQLSRREVLRSRWRTMASMRAQVVTQGRYQGGRPPYGYRLVDAGPHPNTAHARWGRRLHRLAPDPHTAPVVAWIFAQRLTGASAAGIARTLNHLGVACPSTGDTDRYRRHRRDEWSLRTVAAILANPRYTGRQVWNRQGIDHHETVPGDKRTSTGPNRCWNPKTDWVISTRPAHPALVTEADFLRVQTITAVAGPARGHTRRYRWTGLLACAVCGRRLEAHWVHGHPGYRCRHGHTSTSPPHPAAPASSTYARTTSPTRSPP